MFQSLITCKGFIVDESKDKIRFVQEFNDCWIPKKGIHKLERMEKTSEGYTHALVTIIEQLANERELEGILE
jgi:hypothetical protein